MAAWAALPLLLPPLPLSMPIGKCSSEGSIHLPWADVAVLYSLSVGSWIISLPYIVFTDTLGFWGGINDNSRISNPVYLESLSLSRLVIVRRLGELSIYYRFCPLLAFSTFACVAQFRQSWQNLMLLRDFWVLPQNLLCSISLSFLHKACIDAC
jgi:hypothetical protein